MSPGCPQPGARARRSVRQPPPRWHVAPQGTHRLLLTLHRRQSVAEQRWERSATRRRSSRGHQGRWRRGRRWVGGGGVGGRSLHVPVASSPGSQSPGTRPLPTSEGARCVAEHSPAACLGLGRLVLNFSVGVNSWYLEFPSLEYRGPSRGTPGPSAAENLCRKMCGTPCAVRLSRSSPRAQAKTNRSWTIC